MCDYCDNTGKIETDNNGPIVDCPMCCTCSDCGAENVKPWDNGDSKTRCEQCSISAYKKKTVMLTGAVVYNRKPVFNMDTY